MLPASHGICKLLTLVLAKHSALKLLMLRTRRVLTIHTYVLRTRLLLRYLGAFFARFGKADRDGLFAAFTVPPLPPLPDFNVPFLRRSMALLTLLPAAFPYFRAPELFS